MGGFQPQASAIWELQEMGLELWKISGVGFVLFFLFFSFFLFSSCFLLNRKDL